MTGRGGPGPLPWLAALLVLYLAAPIAAFLAWAAGHGLAPTDASQVGQALGLSAATATVATGLMALFGVPLGHRLAQPGRLSAWLSALVHLPLGLPPLASGVILALLFSPNTAPGRLLGPAVVDTPVGIVLAQTFVASPFLVLAARSAFASLPPSIGEAARTLGHGPFACWAGFLLPA
ncbi:MAG: ABC transporter permease subunit, partial [Clostridia bacterium]|nr:ABC transporter permease subunit [Clostridia bacterium]